MDSDLYGYSLEDFKEEAKELLERSENIIGTIQEKPTDPEGVNALFRAVHSLKGSAAYVGLPEVNSYSHAYESFLGELRNNKYKVTDEVINVLVRSRDYLEDLIFHSDTVVVLEVDETIEDAFEKLAKALASKKGGSGVAQAPAPPAPLAPEATPPAPSESGAATPPAEPVEAKAQAAPTRAPVPDIQETQVIPNTQVTPATNVEPSVQAKAEASPSPTPPATVTPQEEPTEVLTQMPSSSTPVAAKADISAEEAAEAAGELLPPKELMEESVEDEAFGKGVKLDEIDPTQMDQGAVIRLTVVQTLESLQQAIKGDSGDREELERLLSKLEDTVVWAFGDDVPTTVIAIEEMRGMVHGTMAVGSELLLKLRKGYSIIAPELRRELVTLGGGEADVEGSTEEDLKTDDASRFEAIDEQEAAMLRRASRDEIVKITLNKNLESLNEMLKARPIDAAGVHKSLDKLGDLNRWTFNEDTEVATALTSLEDLLQRSGTGEVDKELCIRAIMLKELFEPLLDHIGDTEVSAADTFAQGGALPVERDFEREMPPRQAAAHAPAQTPAGENRGVSRDFSEGFGSKPLSAESSTLEASVPMTMTAVPESLREDVTEATRAVVPEAPSRPLSHFGEAEGGQVGQDAGTLRRAAIQRQRQARMAKAASAGASSATLKVKSDDLESLIGTVSGLRGLDEDDFEKLQAATLQLRMVPVGEVFSRFKKVVRDLSEELDNPIKLEVSGESVKLDKAIADKLSEPLLHMVRNAASHGLESAAERSALDKGPAIIRLNAQQEGGQIVIEVTDNGRGISLEKVKKKALSTGLINESEAEGITEKKVLDLIFAPGFSTKESADKVSGRGVGMDVVKDAITSLQGSVTIDTREGFGTTIRLQLPLTLAIIRGMVLEQSGSKIAVPAAAVDRIMNMSTKELTEGCFMDKQRLSLYLPDEGEVIPLVNFSELFNIKVEEDKRCVVLVKVGGGHKVALVVDAALGRQPLTVKPLDRFSETKYFSSATIIDNEVVLILNIPSLLAA